MQALFAFLVSIGVALGGQPLSTSTVFSDHMVLQQGKPVAVWGQGTKGSTVEVSFMDQTKQTTVSDEGLPSTPRFRDQPTYQGSIHQPFCSWRTLFGDLQHPKH